MIGSSDILALAGGHEQADSRTQESSVLPQHLSLPPLARPWPCSPAPSDCVLLCAIGEGEEPQLLFSAPPSPACLQAALRLLIGGYQATWSGHAHSGRDFLEDSWALLGDGASEMCVYVRYVTLLDLRKGRGVWPIAMAMVSHDPGKLLQELQDVNEAFEQASHTLKMGNTHTAFEQASHTLKMGNTHTHMLKMGNTHTHMLKTGNTHTAFEQASHMLKTGNAQTLKKSNIHTPEKENGNQEEGEGHRKEGEGQDYKGELAELCDWSFYRKTVELLCAMQRGFCGDGSLLAHQRECSRLLPPLWTVHFLFEGPDTMHPRYCASPSPSNSVLGTPYTSCVEAVPISAPYMSCVEAVPIRLQAEKHSQSQLSLSPDIMATTPPEREAVSMETGSQSSSDSIEILASECSVTMETAVGVDKRSVAIETVRSMDKHSVTIETGVGIDTKQSVAMETAVGVNTKASVAMKTDWGRGVVGGSVAMETGWRKGVVGGVATGRGAERTDSQDSIEVLSRDIFLPEDLLLQGLMGSVVQEEEEEKSFLPEDFRPSDSVLQRLMGSVVQQEEWLGHVETVVQIEEELQGPLGSAVQDERLGTVAQNKAEAQGVMGTVVQKSTEVQGVMGSVVQDKVEAQRVRGSAVFPSSSLTGWGFHLHDTFQGVCPLAWPLPLCSISQEYNPDDDSGPLASPSPCVGVAWRQKRGEAALRLVRGWSHVRHAVFSLLIGRPLVVVGGAKEKVQELVYTLEFFLPNTHSHTHTHRVLPWCCRPIDITDLLEYSIIGLNRAMCVARYHRYLTLLDADHMTLLGPAYRGSLIGQLMDQSHIREGGTYALLVQSAFTRLAAQAFHQVFSGPEAGPPQRAPDDIRILNFLCDVIKLRLTHHNPPSVFRFNYQPCTHFT